MRARRPPPRARRRPPAPAPKVRPERTGPLRAEIVLVGRDLLRGDVSEAHLPPLARALAERGAVVERVTIVDDAEPSIAAALGEALARNPHLVVTTGGLGPGIDDRTLAAVARALGLPLALSHPARAHVEAAYRRLQHAGTVAAAGLNLAREKLCLVPVGATPVPNPSGVAPGIVCRLPGGAAVVCLPGTAREMRAVLDEALALLGDLPARVRFARREIESPSADEAWLRPLLEQLADEYPDVWVSSRPVGPERRPRIVIVLEAGAPTRAQAESRVERAMKRMLALASGSR